MAGTNLDEVRSAAFQLSDIERAKLAHDLVASLDAPVEADAADAWDKEIARRLAEVEAGSALLIDRDEFRKRMVERLGPA